MTDTVTIRRELLERIANNTDAACCIGHLQRELRAALSQPAQRHTGRKLYVCRDCDGVYADAPVTSCDCNGHNTFDEYVISPVQQRDRAAYSDIVADGGFDPRDQPVPSGAADVDAFDAGEVVDAGSNPLVAALAGLLPDLGDREVLGKTCIDGVKCYRACDKIGNGRCFRRVCCTHFSDYSGPWKYDDPLPPAPEVV